MEIKLSLEEAQAAVQLIDIAVKAGGLQVAEVGVVVSKKIISQLPKPENNAPETQSSTDPEIPMPEIKKEDKK